MAPGANSFTSAKFLSLVADGYSRGALEINLEIREDDAQVDIDALDMEDWHHYCFTYDAAWATLYFDGGVLDTFRERINTTWGTPFRLAHSLWGDLDDLVVYSRALSPAEIAALYESEYHTLSPASSPPPSITPVPSSRPRTLGEASCTFEEVDICGWSLDEGPFSWTWKPRESATVYGTWLGGYVHIDGSGQVQNAYRGPYYLTSPLLNADEGSIFVEFLYYMLNADIGSLWLDYDAGDGWLPQGWTRQGSQGSRWHSSGIIELPSGTRRVRLEAYIGEFSYPDIYVDNVTFFPFGPTATPTAHPSTTAPTLTPVPSLSIAPSLAPTGRTDLGLVSYYAFDGDARSQDGYAGVDCTITNASFGPDRFGNPDSSVVFNGFTTVVCPSALTARISDKAPRSICMWARFDEVTTGALFNYGSTTFGCGEFGLGSVEYSSARLRVSIGTSCVDDPEIGSVERSEWQFYCLNVRKGAIVLYVQGVQWGVDLSLSNTTRDTQFFLGIDGFKGAIDDLRVYSRALESDEVRELLGCPPGRSTASDADGGCRSCDLGRHQPARAQPTCILASPGYFVNRTGATEQTPCEPGRIAAGSGSATCELCVPGRFVAESTQSACQLSSPGSFVAGFGASSQTPCPLGHIAAGSASVNCTSCSPGSFVDRGGSTSCKLASPGSFVASAGASGEDACSPGKISGSGAQACQDCPPGTFAASLGETTCRLVAAGSFVDAAGASGEVACPAGTFSSAGATMCSECGLGTFSVSGSDTCSNCPAGRTTDHAGASECVDCPAGKVKSEGSGECMDCTAPTFSGSSGQSTCQIADAGSFVDSAGASEQVECDVGRFSGSGSTACSDCPAGTFSSSSGQTSCTLADAGALVSQSGQSEQVECDAGRFSGSGSTACSDCPAGAFSSSTGETSCTLADAGAFVGQSGQSEQIECDAGRFSGSGSTACSECPAGTFSGSGAATCTGCPAGRTTIDDGMRECEACPAGTFKGDGSGSCMECEAGTYSPNDGATACLIADAGNFVESSGASAQTPCAAGRTSGSGATSCTDCPAGTFGSSTGQTTCNLCDAGTFTESSGASEPMLCPVGKVSGSGSTTCDVCEPGSFAESSGLTSCALASAGSFVASSGASEEDPCGAGRVAAGLGSTECLACEVGRFAANEGSTQCDSASAGFFVAADGATMQTQCAAGSISPGSGATSCSLCPVGSFDATPNEPSAVCTLASSGSYVLDEGATSQTQCPAGRFSGSGQRYCSQCASGTFSAKGSSTCRSAAAGEVALKGTIVTISVDSGLVMSNVNDLVTYAVDESEQAIYKSAIDDILHGYSTYIDDISTQAGAACLFKCIGTCGTSCPIRRRLEDEAAALLELSLVGNYSTAPSEDEDTFLELVRLEVLHILRASLLNGELQAALEERAGSGSVLSSAVFDAELSIAVLLNTSFATITATYGGTANNQTLLCRPGQYSISGASACLSCDVFPQSHMQCCQASPQYYAVGWIVQPVQRTGLLPARRSGFVREPHGGRTLEAVRCRYFLSR